MVVLSFVMQGRVAGRVRGMLSNSIQSFGGQTHWKCYDNYKAGCIFPALRACKACRHPSPSSLYCVLSFIRVYIIYLYIIYMQTHAHWKELIAVLNSKWIFPSHKSWSKFALAAWNNVPLPTPSRCWLKGEVGHGARQTLINQDSTVSHRAPKTFAAEVRAGSAAAQGNSCQDAGHNLELKKRRKGEELAGSINRELSTVWVLDGGSLWPLVPSNKSWCCCT